MSAAVCVIGAGPTGLAVALRAAKLGHSVALLEAEDTVGGAMRPRRVGDLVLDDGRGDLLLPAALRDLFRKSGRPLERELELTLVPGVRTVMSPTAAIDLPLLGRGAQSAAVAERFGDPAAQVWTSTLDGFGLRWDAARRILENEPVPHLGSPVSARARQLGFPRDFARELRALRGARGGDILAAAVGYPLRRDGQDSARAPAVLAALPYLEQNLGRWHPAGGAGALLDVMARRLGLRGVDVRTGCRAIGLVVRAGVVTGVRTDSGDESFDVVVSAVGVDSLVALLGTSVSRVARRLRRIRPATAVRSTFVRVRTEVVPQSYETVVLGRPEITIRPVPADVWADPDGDSSWVCLQAAVAPADDPDLVRVAASRGVDLTPGTLERHDLPAITWSNGAAVTGWRSFGRLSPITPLSAGHGFLVAGRASYLPAGLPTELLSGALAVAAIDDAANDGAATTLA